MNKEKIAQAAKWMFFQLGTKAVSIDDIAKELGMSKKTIYNFFCSKDEIIEYEIQKHVDQHANKIQELKHTSENAVAEMVEIYRMNYEQHSHMKPVFISDIQKHHCGAWKKLESFIAQSIPTTISENILRGQKEGLYRMDINVAFISFLCQKSILNMIEFFKMQKTYSIADLDKEHIHYHIRAIGTKEGIDYLEKLNIESK